jgi:RimJ/RimL family protein N-acetyltransferase
MPMRGELPLDHGDIASLPIGPLLGGPSAKPPTRVILQGRWVTICPLDPERHYNDLYEGTHGTDLERLWLYMSEGPFSDPESFRSYLVKRAASEDPLSFAIIENSNGRAVGHASYMRITPQHAVIEVGNIFYGRELQRSIGGTEAMFLMAKHVFEDLGYRRYEWKCNALNEPSRRAAERLGFTFEGTFRKHMIQKQRSRDTAWYAMLDDEWPTRRVGFERWLAPDNFAKDGTQRRKLSFGI